MSTDPDQRPTPLASSPSRVVSGTGRVNHRVLHVNVPERIFDVAKAKALISGMAWPDYVVKLLAEARPYPWPAPPSGTEQASTRDLGPAFAPGGPGKTVPVPVPAQMAKASETNTKEQ